MDLWQEVQSKLSAENKKELLKLLSSPQNQKSDVDLAIVGVSGRYPMANNINEFWENLKGGKNCISEIPPDRWDWKCFTSNGAEESLPKWGGFIKDIDKFDPLFFGIAPKEAELMDPQERLFLEVTWTLLEDAGITRKALQKLNNQVGVFVGVMNCDYMREGGNPVSFWSIANRVSYFFNLQGPSLAVDTACSSSLAAVHLACESLRRGECLAAIAGGVNLIIRPEHYAPLLKARMLTQDCRSKAFGENADGFVDAEGVGAILIKRLDQALADRDRIYAIIKGSSMNAGGKTSGYGVPNPNAQANLIKAALKSARVNPRTISYLEAQATGSDLGDSIEIAGLTAVFRQYSQERQFCAIGSVKSNIGHLESAAGIAGITKVLLQMKYKQLVPSLHAEPENSKIDFENSPFYVQHHLTDWNRPVIVENGRETVYPRRAGVSSFGAGGANVHIILDEYDEEAAGVAVPDGKLKLFVLSAKNEERLKAYALNIIDFLDKNEALNLDDLVYTMQIGREAMEERLAIVVATLEELRAKLAAYSKGEISDGCYCGNIKRASHHWPGRGEAWGAEQLQTLIAQENYSALAQLWVRGIEIDWNLLYPEATPKRISLPTYPFLRERFWVPESGRNRISLAGSEQERRQPSDIKDSELREKILSDLAAGIADILKIPPQNIDFETEFLEYGFDPVTLAQFSMYINEKFNLKTTSSTLINYATLDALSRHLVATFKDNLLDHYQLGSAESGDKNDLGDNRPLGNTSDIDAKINLSESGLVRDQVGRTLKEMISQLLGVKEKEIDLEMEMSDFGFNSITLTQFSELINAKYNLGIMPSIFFEHSTLASFIDYLISNFESRLNAYYQNRFPENLLQSKDSDRRLALGNRAAGKDEPKVDESDGFRDQPGKCEIAIIGLSGVMPLSEDLETFWSQIEAGQDLITEIPPDRWDWRDFYGDPALEANKTNIKWGGFMKEIDKFDPQFFGISPREARLLDPQHRIFLETVWKAVEDSGYQMSDLSGKNIGVFVGVATTDYGDLLKEHGVEIQAQTPTGTAHSMLANRISYLFNFHGPSEPVDTACSSSLVAIHRAVESIRNGDCEMAIVGGVNVIIHPGLHIAFSKAGMLSEDGRCKTFDKRANGYVRGEGCGVIVLKPLAKAEADQDHIYAVIRGTAINHGGHANSLTAPNPNAQAELIFNAWQKSGIDPSTVSYIETHGSGTSLGDPVEINGLKKAFARLYQEWNKSVSEPHCGLGTVKTYVGHLETAAGIAGVLNTLLFMKHRKILPNLHFKELNPYIQLDGSPFYIVSEPREWVRLKDDQGREIPRRAGVSSFGFGGVNAHIVLEEYETPRQSEVFTGPYLVALSAKNETVLKNYADRLSDFLEKKINLAGSEPPISLAEVAFTLQTGRVPMEERLALVVTDMQELITKLRQYVSGEYPREGFYRGSVGQQDDSPIAASQILAVVQSGALSEIARLFVQGANIPWELLYPQKPRRVSLPTYPFERERHWFVSESASKTICSPVAQWEADQPEKGHPLIDREYRSADQLGQTVILKTLDRNDPIVSHHLVQGEPVFPGVGYLEMACAAAARNSNGSRLTLSGIVWLRPLIMDEPFKEVRINLRQLAEALHFQIESGRSDQVTIHCQGQLAQEDRASDDVLYLPLDQIKSQCNLEFTQEAIYNGLSEVGLNYGMFFQGLRHIWANSQEALGEIELPTDNPDRFESYILHPSLADAAFQTTIGIRLASGIHSDRILIPYALEKMELIRPLSKRGYAYLKSVGDDRFHALITDEKGQVCAGFYDLTLRELKAPAADFIYIPRWREDTATIERNIGKEVMSGKKVLLFYTQDSLELKEVLVRSCLGAEITEIQLKPGFPELLRKRLESQRFDTIYFLGGIQTGAINFTVLTELDQSQQWGLLSLFQLVKLLLEFGYEQRSLQLKVITNNVCPVWSDENIRPFMASLHGFVKSLAKEFPEWRISCLDIDPDDSEKIPVSMRWERYASTIITEPPNPNGNEVAIRNGKRYFRVLEPVLVSPPESSPFRKNGVYLIIGGAGGIGLELSLYLAKTVQAKLALVGRSELQEKQKMKIDSIEAAGGEVLYLQADVTDLKSLTAAIDEVKKRFGPLNGVIHSALTLKDKSLINMDQDSFQTVLAPKIRGSVALYQAVKDEKLDFMIFFSSTNSFSGSAGQSNYVSASAFEDAFACYWDAVAPYPVKVINWGYWGEVGIVATQRYNRIMAARGYQSITAAEGMEALEKILSFPNNQAAVIKADQAILRETMGCDLEKKTRLYPVKIPRIIRTALDTSRQPLLDNKTINNIGDSFKELENLARLLLLKAFREIGLFRKAGERYDKQKLRDRLRIIPLYFRLYDVLLEILAQGAWIHIDGDTIITSKLINEELKKALDDLEVAKDRLQLKYPSIKAHLRLLTTCMEHLAPVLNGTILATDIIFPNSSMELVEGIYRGNDTADYCNNLVLWSLVSHLRTRISGLSENEKINILEVGAGTGATSGTLFTAIRPYGDQIRYTYSDISLSFVQYGREQFAADNPYVEFKTLDIEKDPLEQGYQGGEYDLVIATNVLHATRNIRNTLRNIKWLLKSNGWLILNEVTEVSSVSSLTFGLLKGWWLYEDEEVRLKGSPLLSVEQWRTILREEGFVNIVRLGPANQDSLSQTVLVSASNGAVGPVVSEPRSLPVNAFPGKLEPEYNINPPRKDEIEEMKDQQLIVNQLQRILAEVLCLEIAKIDIHKAFSDLGLDSILSLEFTRKLKAELGVEVKPARLFDYSTVSKLANYLDSLGVKIEKTTGSSSGIAGGELNRESRGTSAASLVAEIFADHRRSVQPETRDVAIIGMSARFPGADNITEFWKNIQNGVDSVTEVPLERWDANLLYDTSKCYCKWGGFLNKVDYFDPLFFNISPAEAELLEPHQRLFLMEAWRALEDAGYAAESLDNIKCGVYVGVMTNGQYQPTNLFNTPAILAARIAYFLNLKGPAVAIDTACSSSAVAIHMACQSLLNNETEMMLAGGVTLYLTPEPYQSMCKGGMLSREGRCKAFDNSADGFVPAEGVGVVVLKLLDRALADGDQIYGVIKASAMNQDGRTNGITAPSAQSQTELELAVYQESGITPDTISYVECHGTGTKLGDPIEIDALTAAFRRYTGKKRFCPIGSVKTNIGHTSAAAGVAGLIKVLLAMKYKTIPPSLHFHNPNEHIDFDDTPFYVVQNCEDWLAGDSPRRAALSSFGFSGTNVHMIIEEAPEDPLKREAGEAMADPYFLIPLSAKSEKALFDRMKELALWLGQDGKGSRIGDIAKTLGAGRSHFQYRTALIVRDTQELRMKLLDNSGEPENLVISKAPLSVSETFDDAQTRRIINELQPNRGLTESEFKEKLSLLAERYVAGCNPDWEMLYRSRGYRKITLPTYPFQMKSYWVSNSPSGAPANIPLDSFKPKPLAEAIPVVEIPADSPRERKFQITFSGEEFYLRDNIIYGQRMISPAVFPEIFCAVGEMAVGKKSSMIIDLIMFRPIILDELGNIYVSIYLKSDHAALEISADTPERRTVIHARCKMVFETASPTVNRCRRVNIDSIKERCQRRLDREQFYAGSDSWGHISGPSLKTIQTIAYNPNEALATIELDHDFKNKPHKFRLHPSLMHGAINTLSSLMLDDDKFKLMTLGIKKIEICGSLPEKLYAYVKWSDGQPHDSQLLHFDFLVLDTQGDLLLEIKDYYLKKISNPIPASISEAPARSGEIIGGDGKIKIIEKLTLDVSGVIARILKIDDIEIDSQAALLDYGFTSITIIEFINAINDLFKIDVSLDSFFDLPNPTVQSLAGHLYDRYQREIDTYYAVSRQIAISKMDESVALNEVQSNMPVSGDEIPERPLPEPDVLKDEVPQVVVFSAKNKERLKDYVKRIVAFLGNNSGSESETDGPASFTEINVQFQKEMMGIAAAELKTTSDGYELSSVNEFIRVVNERFKLNLTPEKLIQSPSLAIFIKYLGRDYRKQILKHYAKPKIRPDINLNDLAYTLQVGREELEERLAVVASTIEALLEKLSAYCQGENNIEDLYQGNIKKSKLETLFLTDEEGEEFISGMIQRKKYSKLARFWVQGGKLNWNLLHSSHQKPNLISLPPYPQGVSNIKKEKE